MTEQLNEQLNDLAALCATYPDDMAVEITRLRAERDRLLAALQALVREQRDWESPTLDRARAAVTAVEDKP